MFHTFYVTTGSADGSVGSAVLVHNASPCRVAFNKVRESYWKNEAETSAGAWSRKNVERMKQGRAPIGQDGHPMELHHQTPLSRGGTNDFDNLVPMTRTDHRLGSNYGKNHPPG